MLRIRLAKNYHMAYMRLPVKGSIPLRFFFGDEIFSPLRFLVLDVFSSNEELSSLSSSEMSFAFAFCCNSSCFLTSGSPDNAFFTNLCAAALSTVKVANNGNF